MTLIHERHGLVLDHDTTLPVEDVRVEAWAMFAGVERPVAHATTDSDGAFRLRVAEDDLDKLFGAVPASLFFRVIENVSGDKYVVDTKDTLRWVVGQERSAPVVLFRDRDATLGGTPITQFQLALKLVGEPAVTGGSVKLYDANATSDALLTTVASVNVPSSVQVLYNASSITDGKRLADLKVEYLDDRGTLLATSGVLFQAPPTATMTLVVGIEPATSVSAQISAAITGVLDGASPRNLTDAQVDHVARSAELPLSRMRIWSTTDAIASETSLPNDDVYGALSQGLPPDTDTLVAKPPLQKRAALEAAASRGEIAYDATAITSALQRFRDAAVSSSSGLFDDLLDQAGIGDPGDRTSFIQAYSAHEGSVEDFWANQTVLSPTETADVQDWFQVATATHYHTDLLGNATFQDETFTSVAEWDEEDWSSFLENEAVAFPTWSNDTEWSAEANYVKLVTRAFEDALPTWALRGRIAKNDADSPRDIFLRNNVGRTDGPPDFDFRTKRVLTYLDDSPLLGGLTKDQIKAEMLPLERLFKVTHRWDHIAVLEGTFSSAREIAQYGRDKFVADFGSSLGSDDTAALLYDRASAVAFRSQAINLVLNPNLQQDAPPWLADMVTPDEAPGPLTSSWDAYFGSGSQCVCDRCGAVHGPAAYFVDLLTWLDGFASETNNVSGRDVLLETLPTFDGRRPDLGYLTLGCRNVNERVPYTDLVNEVLEWRLADFTSWSAITTSGTEAQRLAAPRIENEQAFKDAYELLDDAVYPWNLPFSLPHAQARAFLDHLGRARHALMRTLGASSALAAAEQLGLTPVSRQLVTGQASSGWHAHWGFRTPNPVGGDWFDVLAGGDTFAERARLSFIEVQALLESQFATALSDGSGLSLSPPIEDVLCKLDLTSVTGLTKPDLGFELLHRFVRLRHHLGGTVAALDAAVATFGGALTDGTLVSLAGARRVAERANRELVEVLPWWGDLDTFVRTQTEAPSLYQALFQSGAGGTLGADDLPNPGADVPTEIEGCMLWARADIATLDDADVHATDGGAVASWLDLTNPVRLLSQATSAARPTLATEVTALGSQAEVTFDDTDDMLVSNAPAAAFKALHDGTGCTVFVVLRPSAEGVVLTTHNLGASDVGLAIDTKDPDDLRVRIGNGSGTWLANQTSSGSAFAQDQGVVATVQHGSGLDRDVKIFANGTLTDELDYTGSPSTADPTATLHIGNRPTGSVALGGGVAEIILYDRLLSDAERARVEAYLMARYDIGGSAEGLHSLAPGALSPIVKRVVGMSDAQYALATSAAPSTSPLRLRGPAGGLPPSLSQLSALYRLGRLADALGLSVEDALVLDALEPAWSGSPGASLTMMDHAARLEEANLSVADVHYLLRHVERPVNGVLAREAAVTDAVAALGELLDSIDEETTAPDLVTGDVLRDALRGALEDARPLADGDPVARATAIEQDIQTLLSYVEDTTLPDDLGGELATRTAFVEQLLGEIFVGLPGVDTVFSAFYYPDNPWDLASCASWCDANSISGDPGDEVAVWSARPGGVAFDAISATASEQPSVALTPLVGLTFDASTQGMSSASAIAPATMLCFATPTDTASYALLRADDVTLSNAVPASNPARPGYSTAAGWTSGGRSTSAPQMLTVRLGATEGNLFLEGGPVGLPGGTEAVSATTILLGTDDAPTTDPKPFQGVVHAVGIFTAALTVAELARVHGLVAAYYGMVEWRRSFLYRALMDLQRRRRVQLDVPPTLSNAWSLSDATGRYLLDTLDSTAEPPGPSLLDDYRLATTGGHLEPDPGGANRELATRRFDKAALLVSALSMSVTDVDWLLTRPVGTSWSAQVPTNGVGQLTLPTWLQYTCPTSGTSARQGPSTVKTGYPAHAPRATSDDGSAWGLLVEPAADNHVSSQDLGTWSPSGSPLIHQVLRPDGRAGANELEDQDGGAVERTALSVRALAPSTAHTLSTWMFISAFSGSSATLLCDHDIGANEPRLSHTATDTDWAYRSGTATTPAGITLTNLAAYATNTVTATETGSCRYWGMQIEKRSYPTSLIGADNLHLHRAAATLSSPGAVVAPEGYFGVTITYRPQYAHDETSGDHHLLYVDDDNRLTYRTDGHFVLRLAGQELVTATAATFSRGDEIVVTANHLATGSSLVVDVPGMASQSESGPARATIDPTSTVHFFGSPEVTDGVVLRSMSWSTASRWLDLNALALTRPADDSDLPVARAQFGRLLHLLDTYRLADHLVDGREGAYDIAAVAAEPGATLADVHLAAADRSRWPETDLTALQQRQEPSATVADYVHLSPLTSMVDALEAVRELGVSVETAERWVDGWDTDSFDDALAVARETLAAAGAKYDTERWYEVARPLRDRLREEQRDALVEYVVHDEGKPSRDALFEELLLDVDMSPCMLVSRLSAAIGSIQLFVHRALLGLESGLKLPKDAADQWEWRKTFALWEANRKVFLYPEDFLEPELRDDKTPFFRRLESDLRQAELSDALIEKAYLTYLRSLDEVAKMDVVGVFHEETPANEQLPARDRLHVYARTKGGLPGRLFYRQRVDRSYWTAWEHVDIDVVGSSFVPLVWHGRHYLFMLELSDYVPSPQLHPDQLRSDLLSQARLFYSQKEGDSWSNPLGTEPVTVTQVRIPEHGYVFARPYLQDGDATMVVATMSPTAWTAPQLGVSPLLEQHSTVSLGACRGVLDRMHALDGTLPLFHPTTDADVEAFGVSYHHGRLGWPNQGRWTRTYDDSDTPDPEPLALPVGAGTYNLIDEEVAWRVAFDTTNWLLSKSSTTDVLQTVPRTAFFVEVGDEAVPTLFVTLASDPSADPNDYIEQQAQLGPVDQQALGQTSAALSVKMSAAPKRSQKLSNVAKQGLVSDVVAPLSPFNFFAVEPTPLHIFDVQVFEHPYVCEIRELFHKRGLSAVLEYRARPGTPLQELSDDAFGPYTPTSFVEDPPAKDIDFRFGGAYAQYNWELFFHVPMLISHRLRVEGKYRQALRWLEAIFDPGRLDPGTDLKEAWGVRPFRDLVARTQLEAELKSPANPTTVLGKWLYGALGGDPDSVSLDFEAQLRALEQDPFNPHLLARMRPVAYQRATLRQYVEILLDWGDKLFRRDTMESLVEAQQLYVFAHQILGPGKETIEVEQAETTETYLTAEAQGFDVLGNVDTEALVAIEDVPLGGPPTDKLPVLPTLLFCVPQSTKNDELREKVQDRLFKIRHCMNIEGIVRELPLFQPPVDPALIVRARAAGLDFDAILDALYAPKPLHRYRILHDRAVEFASAVAGLGQTLLGALERRDTETLTLLRSSQEIDLLERIEQTRKQQVDEAAAAVEALSLSLAVATHRRDHFVTLLAEQEPSDPSTLRLEEEEQAVAFLDRAKEATVRAWDKHNLAANVWTAPVANFGTNGGIPSVAAFMSYGSQNIASEASARAGAASSSAGIHQTRSSIASTRASYLRREHEWKFQRDAAERDMAQITQQRVAAMLRHDIAKSELASHQKQLAQAKQVEAFHEDKFTSEELHDWMVSRVGETYHDAFQLALRMAKQAQSAFQFERAAPEQFFLSPQHWEGSRRGLLAGERLLLDLRRMEEAYLESDVRERELVKHVSLAERFPEQLLRLKDGGANPSGGVAELTLDEALFDEDYPGQYLRRIRSVRITMPAVTGPHTSVNATLAMTQNKIRKSTSVGKDYAEVAGTDPRFLYDFAKIQSIATSTGIEDPGVFELRFDDRRLMPFEGAGAVGSWRLEMEQALNRFDLHSLSDVVLHIEYTARSGAALLEQAARAAQAASTEPKAHRLVRLSHEFPNAWEQFQLGDGGGTHTLAFTLQGRVPFLHLADSEVAKVSAVSLAAVGEATGTSPSPSYTLNTVTTAIGSLVAPVAVAVTGLPLDAETTTWTFVASNVDDISAFTELYAIFALEPGSSS